MTEIARYLVANPEALAALVGLLVAVFAALYKRIGGAQTPTDAARVRTLLSTLLGSFIVTVAAQAATGELTWQRALTAGLMAFAASQGWYALGKGAVRTGKALAIPPIITPTLLVLLLLLVPLVPAHAQDMLVPDAVSAVVTFGGNAGYHTAASWKVAEIAPVSLWGDVWDIEELVAGQFDHLGYGLSAKLDAAPFAVGVGWDRAVTVYVRQPIVRW